MTQKKLASVLILLSTFLFGCLSTATAIRSKSGPEYNAEREKIGLPIIPSDWTIDAGSGPNEGTWYAPNWKKDYDQRIPVHVSKYVNFASGEINYESDKYFGKGDWDCEGSICRDSLFITYCYNVNSVCKEENTWQVIYQSQETEFGGQFISFEEAKKILADWGLSYP